jgi:hypothetical protein
MGLQNITNRKAFYTATLVVFFVFAQVGYGQTDSEVYLAYMTFRGDTLKVTSSYNLSQNPGYDNQPTFDSETGVLYYARSRNAQTDIAWFDPESGNTSWYSDTPGRSEYSPMRIPGSGYISAIGLDTTGLQRLYRYSEEGSQLIIPNLKVGYQLWINPDLLVCTVLVEDHMDLVLVKFDKEQQIIDKRVGRSLHKISGTKTISYTKPGDTGIEVYQLDPYTGKTQKITTLPAGVQDMCWLSDGSLLCGGEGVLLRYHPNQDESWKVVHQFKSDFGKISRLAINPSGTQLALVVE